MSSKQSTSKPDPRIAKKEVMVTRHKSAQMKRQLRVKDRSMKHITDLLKSPSRETQMTSKSVQTKTKTPPKLKQSLLQSVEKVQKLPEKVFRLSKMLRKKVATVRGEEYHPTKGKRKVQVNRVVLKPTRDLKMVGSITGSVKRKSAVPRRASNAKVPSPKASRPVYAELSMAEVIRLVEDDLTDEDMMEILTCPSPVWWEDPPDGDYIEDAIFTRSPEPPEPEKKPQNAKQTHDKMDVDVVNLVETESVVDKPIEITNLDAKSDNFLKKRSKLEGLLGHIKNKTNTKIRQTNKDVFNEDVVVICSGYRKDDKDNLNEHKSDSKEVKENTLSESDGDEISFHDSSMNVDEFLKDLENMDIPIEGARQPDVIVIEDDDDFLDTNNKQKNENKKRPKKETIKMKTNSDETLHMLKNVPILKKYRLDKEFASPKSSDSLSSKNGESSQDLDSISDTNVKFLLDDEVEEQNKNTNDGNVIKSRKDTNKNSQTFEVDKQAYANEGTTVFKIIEEMSNSQNRETNHADVMKNNDDKEVKMNDYYKTCKKINQKKIKRVEPDKTDFNRNDLIADVKVETDTFMLCEACKPQTKKVSDDKNVKYCLKCSCIFDSTDCTYCIEKSKSNVYKCVSCRIKFCCEAYFKVHALSHMEGKT